jgi:hypothetical protein
LEGWEVRLSTLRWIFAYQMVISRLEQPVEDTLQRVFAGQIFISSLSLLFSFPRLVIPTISFLLT